MGQPVSTAHNRDRRAHERVPTGLRAKVFPGPLDCVISDFSDRGARLTFAQPPMVGESIVLVVWSSGLAFEARTRWSAGLEVGLEFLHKRDFRRPVPADLAAIRALWLKRRPRIRRKTLAANPAMIVERKPPRRY
jgi:hypothetical protein